MTQPSSIRLAIVSDQETNWHVHRVNRVELVPQTGELVYVCDQYLGGPFKSIEDMIEVARDVLRGEK